MTTRQELQAELRAPNESFQFDEARLIGQVERARSAYESKAQKLLQRRLKHAKESTALQEQINRLASEEVVT